MSDILGQSISEVGYVQGVFGKITSKQKEKTKNLEETHDKFGEIHAIYCGVRRKSSENRNVNEFS